MFSLREKMHLDIKSKSNIILKEKMKMGAEIGGRKETCICTMYSHVYKPYYSQVHGTDYSFVHRSEYILVHRRDYSLVIFLSIDHTKVLFIGQIIV